jgi:lipoprotein Spr
MKRLFALLALTFSFAAQATGPAPVFAPRLALSSTLNSMSPASALAPIDTSDSGERLARAMAALQVAVSLDTGETSNDQSETATVLETAESMLGIRYRLGANSASAMDCSAFMRRIFLDVGIELPRSTTEQMKVGSEVDADRLQPGDLLFYRWARNRLHVAVYVGGGEILHASPAAHKVTRTRLNDDWNRRFVEARRLI